MRARAGCEPLTSCTTARVRRVSQRDDPQREMNFREYEPDVIKSRQELGCSWSGYTVGEAATATILTADSD